QFQCMYSCERILRFIQTARGLVETDLLDAEVLEHLEERFPEVTERHRAVVREPALDEHMAVEPPHFGNGEHADGAEGVRCNGQHFALRHIRAEMIVCRTLQTEEGDLPGNDVPFQRA